MKLSISSKAVWGIGEEVLEVVLCGLAPEGCVREETRAWHRIDEVEICMLPTSTPR